MRYVPTSLVILIEVSEFYVQNSSLYLIKPTVTPRVFKHIFRRTTIVGKRTNHDCQIIIISSHRPTIAESTKILTRIKRVPGSISYITSHAAVIIPATMALRTILH